MGEALCANIGRSASGDGQYIDVLDLTVPRLEDLKLCCSTDLVFLVRNKCNAGTRISSSSDLIGLWAFFARPPNL
jgi:hypothetical protein